MLEVKELWLSMLLDVFGWAVSIVVALFLVYCLVRLIGLAWYKSKVDMIRRLLYGTDKER